MSSMSFEDRCVEILNSQAVGLALGLAGRVGLLEALDETPRSAEELARESQLSERYVRELLAVLATGRVVELVAGDGDAADMFSLASDRKATLRGYATYMEELPLLAECAFSRVAAAARDGSGVPAAHYGPFHEWMGRLADDKHGRLLCDRFLPSVQGGRLLSKLEAGIRVMDLGCGEGRAVLLMAERFPRSTFVGVDVTALSLRVAQSRAEAAGLGNVSWQQLDAAELEAGGAALGKFDMVLAFDAIHDMPRPEAALRGVLARLSPDGVFCMVDIKARSRLADNVAHPLAPLLYGVSLMHCMPVALVDGGAGLGMMWGRERARAMMEAAGFVVEEEEMEFDAFNLNFVGTRPDSRGEARELSDERAGVIS